MKKSKYKTLFLNFLKKHIFFRHIILALTTLFLLFFFWLIYINIYTHHNRYIKAPDFSGFHISQLDSLATANNLRYIIIDSIFDLNKEKGIVINQDPKAFTNVKKNRKFYVTITCLKNRKVIFPDIYDLTLRQAVYKLKNLGLQIGHLDYRPNLAKNKVIGYHVNGNNIIPGLELYEGTIVDLIIGKGLSSNYITVPNLIGLNRFEANIVLKSNSLNLGTEFFDTDILDSSLAIIYKQLPESNNNRKVKIGSSIDLFYKDLINFTNDSL